MELRKRGKRSQTLKIDERNKGLLICNDVVAILLHSVALDLVSPATISETIGLSIFFCCSRYGFDVISLFSFEIGENVEDVFFVW